MLQAGRGQNLSHLTHPDVSFSPAVSCLLPRVPEANGPAVHAFPWKFCIPDQTYQYPTPAFFYLPVKLLPNSPKDRSSANR